MQRKAANPVKAVEHTCELLVALKDLDGATVTQLANHLDLSKSTVSNHLATLAEQQFVVEDDRTYKLSLRWLNLGGYVRDNHRLYQIAKEAADDLGEETGELVTITTLNYGKSIYLYRANEQDAVTYDSFVGARFPLHCTASGKVLLAGLPDERIQEIVDYWGLPQKTANTITEIDELFEEIAVVREQGYANDDEERIDGMRGIAAPIVDGKTQETLGTIALGGPTSHIYGDRFKKDLPNRVIRHAKMASINVTYD